MTYEESLKANLTAELGLPPDAVSWLLDLWAFTQTFDDIVDSDAPSRAELDKMLWLALVGMPKNEFYRINSGWLIPTVASFVLEWMASDNAERNGRADARSYVWRAGFYRVVCMVASIVHGPSSVISEASLALYGETLDEYLKEFPHA